MAKHRTSQGKRPRTPAAASRTSETRTTFADKPKPGGELPRPIGTPDPVAWFGVDVTSTKLVLARFLVFGLLALDSLLQIQHAPRYGATDFNVGQLAVFDSLGPGRVAYGALQLVIAYSLVLAAFGIAMRLVLPVAAIAYAWLYFGSQLDSYQHHYLVALALVIACFIPWHRRAEPTAIRSWAVRLLLVQLGIMYLWAAISKLDPAWVDGRTLALQVSGSMRGVVESTVGFKVMAVLVIAVELALAATVWMRRTWFIAAPLGLAFHGGILLTGLEIGLFAFLMVAIYAFVVPDRIWVWCARTAPVAALRGWLAELAARRTWVDFAVALAVGVALAVLTRLPHALVVGVIATTLPLVLALRGYLKRSAPAAALGLVHVIALALWLIVDRTSDVTHSYYKFWGGSQRRLQHPETAEQAYRTLIEVAPEDPNGHYQLGRLLLSSARADEGLRELHEAQRLDPSRARAWIEESRWLAQNQRRPEALAKAQEAVAAEPSNQEARALLDSLSGSRAAPKPGPVTDDDSQ